MTTIPPKQRTAAPAAARTHSVLYSAVIGLCALAILLQGLWAGIFLEHDGQRDAAGRWIDVHALGGEIALGLAALATVVGFIRLRQRWDLWVGSLVLTALLVLEGFLGGQIRDDGKDSLTAVHIPLAMGLMSLVVWLSARSALARRRGADSAGYPADRSGPPPAGSTP